MQDLASSVVQLLQTVINALSGRWQQAVLTGSAAMIFVVLSCWVIERRLTGETAPSAFLGLLVLVYDIKLLTLAAVAIVLILAWLVATLYALYRSR